MDEVERQLTLARTIAVVGMSPRPDRPSHYVAKYLMEQGYTIIPVNPAIDEVLGLRCYPDLRAVPQPVDLVDVFRRSREVPPIVDAAIEIGARFVWMQDGVVHEGAAAKARAAGLSVVMDNCMLREHMRRYGGEPPSSPASAGAGSNLLPLGEKELLRLSPPSPPGGEGTSETLPPLPWGRGLG